MDEQREQARDERPVAEATGELEDAELEQAVGGLTAGTYWRGLLGVAFDPN